MYFSIYLLVFVVQLIEKYSGIAFTQLFADLRWCVLYKLIVGFFIVLHPHAVLFEFQPIDPVIVLHWNFLFAEIDPELLTPLQYAIVNTDIVYILVIE